MAEGQAVKIRRKEKVEGKLPMTRGRMAMQRVLEADASGEVAEDLRTFRYEVDAELEKARKGREDELRKKIVMSREALEKLARARKSGPMLVSHQAGSAFNMMLVAKMRMEGKYWWEIAEQLQMTGSQMNEAQKYLRGVWLESALVDFNERKAEEVAKIDYLERKNWEEISRVNEIASRRDDGMTELDFRRVKAAQDVIMWCIVQRTKIFGLEAPVKVDWKFEAEKHGIDANKVYHALVKMFAEQIVDAETVKVIEATAPQDEELEEELEEQDGEEGKDDDSGD